MLSHKDAIGVRFLSKRIKSKSSMTDTITLPLRKLIDELLPEGIPQRSIDPEIANIIYGLYLNKSTVVVQFEDCDDYRTEKPATFILQRPKLWRFNAWTESSAIWRKAKDWEHKTRVSGWLRSANTKIVKAQLLRTCDYTEEFAGKMAYQLVSKGLHQNMRALGVSKILTKEEELQ